MCVCVCGEREGQRGTTTNDVALCFDDAEQVFDFMRTDGCLPFLRAASAAFHCFLFCLFFLTGPSGRRCGVKSRRAVPALSAVIFIISIAVFLSSDPRTRKGSACLLMFVLVGLIAY